MNACRPSTDASPPNEKGRVIFLLELHPGSSTRFLEAYEHIRLVVAAGVPGHLNDQVCESADDPHRWVITSEWAHLDDFDAWERSEEHRTLVAPLRECIAAARSLRFRVRRETHAVEAHAGEVASVAETV